MWRTLQLLSVWSPCQPSANWPRSKCRLDFLCCYSSSWATTMQTWLFDLLAHCTLRTTSSATGYLYVFLRLSSRNDRRFVNHDRHLGQPRSQQNRTSGSTDYQSRDRSAHGLCSGQDPAADQRRVVNNCCGRLPEKLGKFDWSKLYKGSMYTIGWVEFTPNNRIWSVVWVPPITEQTTAFCTLHTPYLRGEGCKRSIGKTVTYVE